MRRGDSQTRWLALLAAVNFALVLWFFRAARTAVPNTGDEWSVLFQAKIFASGRLTAPAPAPAEAFTSDYIAAQGGRWSSIYPPLFPAFLALGVRLGGVNALLAGLSSAILLLVFRVSRRVFDDLELAWAATLMYALSPAFRFYSASYYTHPASLALLLLALDSLPLERLPGRASQWRWERLALCAGLGLGVRPYDVVLWLALILVVGAAAVRAERKRQPALRAARAGLLIACGALVVAAFWGAQAGSFGRSIYLETVNSNHRFEIWRNLRWESFSRLFAMSAESAKWLLAYGLFRGASLADPRAGDWNLSLPVAAAALAWGAYQARRRGSAARGLLLGLVACLVAGHLFYDKLGGRFGERRFFNAGFIVCAFLAEAVLAGCRRLKFPAWPAFAALAATSVCVYIPSTLAWVRESTDRRMQVYDDVERLGLRRGLIFIQDAPDFYPRFYARNAPDLSGNLYAVSGYWNDDIRRRYPDRPAYVFGLDGTPAYRLTPLR